jgi:two-component system, NtrC family, response regulator AtoC
LRAHANILLEINLLFGGSELGAHADVSLSALTFGSFPPENIIFGRSRKMDEARKKVEKVSLVDIPVLIQGDSGTGKEIIARLIHVSSPWSEGPFVKVNCPAIPGTLLESELFGYERGAFTGAFGAKPGRMEMASGGTVFLDEISELEIGLQAKLLQFLQDGRFCRIGAKEDTHVEARVVCATNRNLQQSVEVGAFREDLFYRINVVMINLAPLSERAEDIPDLVEYFLNLYNQKFGLKVRPLSGWVMKSLEDYSWPGNIRQLENLVKRYVILGSEESIVGELSAARRELPVAEVRNGTAGVMSLKKVTREAVLEIERDVILKALQANNWNRKRTAKTLSISYRALLYKIRQANLPSARGRPSLPETPMQCAADA